MKALFYTNDFTKELYYFLEERVTSIKGPIITIELFDKDNHIEAWYQSEKKFKSFNKILEAQGLIRNCVNGRNYLDMEKILRWSFSDYKVHSYGIEFTNVREDGVISYSFNNTSINPWTDDDVQTLESVKKVNAGSYLHARIKLYKNILQSGYGLSDYEYLGNNLPTRFIQGY